MAKPSVLDRWLRRFPETRRQEIEQQIRSAPNSLQAYRELKRLGFKFSYDSVKNWRAKDAKHKEGEPESKTAWDAASVPSSDDPIKMAMNLACELNSLCQSLTNLLQRHVWLEPGETRLSNREASKILTALPGLSRAASTSIVELSRCKVRMEDKLLAQAVLTEMSLDWQRALESDNPELVPLFQEVASITRVRLEIDRPSLLENYLNHQQEPKEQATV